jgi:hypothetical protein
METISIEPVSPSNTKEKAEWKSCCFSINQSATKYFVQVGILSLLIVYSATMLVVNQECESQRNFAGLLMICLGTLVPSPKMT